MNHRCHMFHNFHYLSQHIGQQQKLLTGYVAQLYNPIVRRTKNQLFPQPAVKNDFFPPVFPTSSVWEFWYAVGMFYVSCLPSAFQKTLVTLNIQSV